MLSCVALMEANQGRLLAWRDFRGDVSRLALVDFGQRVIRTRETEVCPIATRAGSSFLFVREGDIFIVASTRLNANSLMAFEFLNALVHTIRQYFGGVLNSDKVRLGYTLLYAILDEAMDYGYPQVTSYNLLKDFILEKGMPKDPRAMLALREKQKNLTLDVTGAVAWRRQGIAYKKNELFLDTIENVSALLTPSGEMLFGEVSGRIVMKSQLSGMPECKLGLNDKILMEQSDASAYGGGAGVGGVASGVGGPGEVSRPQAVANLGSKREVALDSLKFHQCVRLKHFEATKEIMFVPPDGEFDLVQYRLTESGQVKLPFKVVPAYHQPGRTRAEMTVKVRADYPPALAGYSVRIEIPVPKTTSAVKTEQTAGKAKFDKARCVVVWKISEFPGMTEATFNMGVSMLSTVADKAWEKPPIKLTFSIPMFTSSGMRVRFLKVFEKSGYAPTKWVRYLTQSSGNYECRI